MTAGRPFSPSSLATNAVRVVVFYRAALFTFTFVQSLQPALTCCTLPGSYKVLPQSESPNFLTPHSISSFALSSSTPLTPSSHYTLPSSVNMTKSTDSPAGGQKMIPADCVSVLLMALGCTSISREQLNMMSALDGTRTASSFEHQFRSISAKAKELKKRVDDGEKFSPVQPGQKRGLQRLRRVFLNETRYADQLQEERPRLPHLGRGRATTPKILQPRSRRQLPSLAERRRRHKPKYLQLPNLQTTTICPRIWPSSSSQRNNGKTSSSSNTQCVNVLKARQQRGGIQ